MTLTLRLRQSIFDFAHFSFGLLHFIGFSIHQRIQRRRFQRTLPAAPQPMARLTPTEIETLQVSEAVSSVLLTLVHQPFVEVPAEVETTEPTGQIADVLQDNETSQDIGQLELNPRVESRERTALVLQLLDEAYHQGFRTYAQLIDYVKEQTGEGCSKRIVASWKRSRGLIEKAA